MLNLYHRSNPCNPLHQMADLYVVDVDVDVDVDAAAVSAAVFVAAADAFETG